MISNLRQFDAIYPFILSTHFQFRTTRSKAVRGNLFSVDKGICQMCNFNSHELFQRVSALRKKDRRAVLEQTHFISLPASLLNKMITDPKEGQVNIS